MSGREQAVQRSIRRALAERGWLTVKISPGMGAPVGFPDLVAMRPDRAPVLIEVKTRIGRLSPAQARQHQRLAARGYKVVVARSACDALRATCE